MLKHSIVNLKNKILTTPFYISGLFLFFSIIFLFIFFNKISHNSLIEQIQHRQQVTARAGAKSIESFLNGIGRTTAILADDPSQKKLEEFVELWEDDNVVGVVSIDKNGKVLAASNREDRVEIGESVIERGYFQWAKTAKKGEFKIFPPVISKIGASKGHYIITITSPIIDLNGEFNGAVTTAVLLSDLANAYLSNLKVLESSRIYLVRQEGEIIYSDYPKLTGQNFKDIFKSDFLGKETVLKIISDELESASESKLKLAIPNFQNGFNLEPYLLSFSPISLTNNLWKVVVVTPEKDLLMFTYNSLNKQVVAVFIVAVIFILLTLRSSRNSGYGQAVVDEHKEHNIRYTT